MTKSRSILAPRRQWTEVELELLRRNYADTRTEDLAIVIGRKLEHVYAKATKLGLAKSEAYLASPAAKRLSRDRTAGMVANQFKKGHVPQNKGKKMPPGWAPGDMAKTQFKKGNMPHTWVPVGSYRTNPDGRVEVKLNDDPGPYYIRWKPVHRHVWELANGPIPKGHVVAFKPGHATTDPALITVDKLELITLAENLKRNSLHRYPPEIVKVIQLRGAITRQINKRSKIEESYEQ